MPAIEPLAAGSVVLVSFRSVLFDQRIINTFQYYPVGTIDPDTEYDEYLSNLITNLQAFGGMVDKWAACVPYNITQLTIRAQPVYPVRQRYVEQTIPIVAGGALTTLTNIAASITRKSHVIGMHGVGRIQIPVVANEVTNGVIPVTSILGIKLADLAQKMLAPVPDPALTVDWVPVIWSSGGVIPTQQVFQSQVQDTSRVMRRRTVRVGE